jgi:RNA polymerase sigma factor (sigma-70 family)
LHFRDESTWIAKSERLYVLVKMQKELPLAGKPGESPDQTAHALQIERLFREHNEALLRFLQSRLHSQQDAREVAQEAYVRLLSLHSPGAVSYLRAFLFQTAANLALDRLRRGQVHNRATAQPMFTEFVDNCTPERRVAGAQQLEKLQRLLQALPPKCQRAFLLNRFYGMDFDAIAQEMGLQARMVRVYVVRALLYCRSQMSEETRGD